MNLENTGSIILTTVITDGGSNTPEPLLTPASKLEFPALPYAFDALQPHIDAMTMEIHYTKHHKAYYDNLLKAVGGTEMAETRLVDIFSSVGSLPAAVRNNGGGFYNHLLFWRNMAPAGIHPISQSFEALLTKTFGTFNDFKTQFSDAGKTRFGSGWAWLTVDQNGALCISSTPNQDNPLMDVSEKKGTPLLALDVWEHAYYLKYQNRRPDYIENWWQVVNWSEVEARYKAVVQ